MDQRVHFVTVSTADLDAARRFYVDGLGWTPTLDVPEEIIFFQIGPGMLLGLFESARFADDLGGAAATAMPTGVTLAHNVESPEAVDAVLAQAASAGGQVLKPGQHADFGGYHGHVRDPNGLVWEVAHNPGWRVDDDGTVRLDAPDGG